MNSSGRGQRLTSGRPRMRIRYFRLDVPDRGADVRKVLSGEVLPVITITVLLVNVLMLIVFYKGRFKNSTHMILISIAIADSLNGLFFLVPSMHFFTFNNDQDYIAYNWCLVFFIFELISRVSHGSSLFYTVFLAVHRYVYVRFPFKAKTLCSKKYTLVTLSVVPVVSFLIHTFLIVRLKTYYGAYKKSIRHENRTIYACAQEAFHLSTLVIWIPTFFLKILPIATLIVFSILLIIELRLAAKNIKHLTTGQEEKMRKRKEKNRRITLLTVAVIFCVLCTEIPGFIAHIVIRYSSAYACKECSLVVLATVNQLTITLFFPANFLIYCLVINRFRKALLSILLSVAYKMPSCCVAKFTRDVAKSLSTTEKSGEKSEEKTPSTIRTGLSKKHYK